MNSPEKPKESNLNNENINEIEEEIEKLIEEAEKITPEELLEEPKKSYEKAETVEELLKIQKKFQEIIEHRKKDRLNLDTLPDKENEFITKQCPKEKLKQIKKEIEKIKEKIENGEITCLGEGRVAQVFPGEEDPFLCIKIIKEEKDAINIYNTENNIIDEIKIQEEVEKKVKINNARVPKPYYAQYYKNFHFIVMENLEAVTLKEVLESPDSLPENFDYEKFFVGLEEFVKKLNENKIFHRDLHEGNIMIDKNNGNCYIIDLGTAIRSFNEDEACRKIDPRTNKMIKTTKDSDNVKNLKIKIKQILSLKKGGKYDN